MFASSCRGQTNSVESLYLVDESARSFESDAVTCSMYESASPPPRPPRPLHGKSPLVVHYTLAYIQCVSRGPTVSRDINGRCQPKLRLVRNVSLRHTPPGSMAMP